MSKYTNKEIERANRATLTEMAESLHVLFDEKLKNAELRELVIKANDEWVEERDEQVSFSVETVDPVEQTETVDPVEQTETVDPVEQTETVDPSNYIKSVMAARRLKTKQLKESENPSVSQAIKSRRGASGISISDAIRQRRLGKK